MIIEHVVLFHMANNRHTLGIRQGRNVQNVLYNTRRDSSRIEPNHTYIVPTPTFPNIAAYIVQQLYATCHIFYVW